MSQLIYISHISVFVWKNIRITVKSWRLVLFSWSQMIRVFIGRKTIKIHFIDHFFSEIKIWGLYLNMKPVYTGVVWNLAFSQMAKVILLQNILPKEAYSCIFFVIHQYTRWTVMMVTEEDDRFLWTHPNLSQSPDVGPFNLSNLCC